VIGKIGDHDSRVGIEADLTSLKLDNILPGWVKVPGKSGKATFSVVKKEQSDLFQDIVVDGGGVSIKGSVEVDQNGDLLSANSRPIRRRTGDKTSLKAERGTDGVVKVTMRGDVFDGRGFLKSAISAGKATPRAKPRTSILTSISSSASSRATTVKRCAASMPSFPGAAATSRPLH